MTIYRCFLTVAAIALIFAFETQAAVINYDETVDGDLVLTGNAATSTSLGTFDIGMNTVSGQLTYAYSSGGSVPMDVADPFRFNIAAGHQLTAVTLVYALMAI